MFQRIKTANIRAAKFLAVLFMLVLAFIIWIATGPHHIDFAAKKLAAHISEILPQSTNVYIESATIELDAERDIVLALNNVSVEDETNGNISLNKIKLKLEPLAILPFVHKNLINVEISLPDLKKNGLAETGISTGLPIEKLDEYINAHQEQILKYNFSIENTSITTEFVSGNPKVVNLRKFSIVPHKSQMKIAFDISAEVLIDGNPVILKAELDSSSRKHLSIKGTVENISHKNLEYLGVAIPYLTNSDIAADLKFNTLIKSAKNLDYIEFELDNFKGKINENEHFKKSVKIEQLNLKGYCFSNCSEVEVDKFHVKAEELDLIGSFIIKPENNNNTLSGKFILNSILIDSLQDYWPKYLIPRTRDWIFESIKGGQLKAAKGDFHFNLDDLIQKKGIRENDLHIELTLADTKVFYMDNVPPVSKIDASMVINGSNITFEIPNAVISNSKVSNLHGIIPNLGTSKARVDVTADIDGSAQDLIDLAYAHAFETNNRYKNLNGSAATKVVVSVPLGDEDITLDTLKLDATSEITNLSAKNVYKDLSISDGKFKAKYENKKAFIDGSAKVNEHDTPSQIKIVQDFDKNTTTASASNKIKWEEIEKFGYKKPEAFNNFVTISFNSIETPKGESANVDLNLAESTIYIPQIGVFKKLGEPATINLKVLSETAKQSKVEYNAIFPGLKSAGNITYNKGSDVLELLQSDKTEKDNSSFSINYVKSGNKVTINISGDSFDINGLRPFKGGAEKASSVSSSAGQDEVYDIKISTKKIRMFNDVTLKNKEASLICGNGRCQKIILNGHFDGGEFLEASINNGKLALSSNDAGKTLKAFNISNKVEGGVIQAVGHDTHGVFKTDVQITSEYHVKKASTLAKILSLASITKISLEGISNLFSSEGIRFKSLNCNLDFAFSYTQINSCAMTGPTLAINFKGDVNLVSEKIKVDGVLVPENIIDKILHNIPIINKIFESDDHVVGITFTVTGNPDDPDINVNPLSAVTPSFIKKIFSSNDDADS